MYRVIFVIFDTLMISFPFDNVKQIGYTFFHFLEEDKPELSKTDTLPATF